MNQDFLVKLVLVFAISVLAYAAGMYAGTQVASDTDRKRAALEQEYSEGLAKALRAHEPTYQEQADEINKADSINTDCRPSLNNLSPKEQLRRVNEIMRTPNEKEGLR